MKTSTPLLVFAFILLFFTISQGQLTPLPTSLSTSSEQFCHSNIVEEQLLEAKPHLRHLQESIEKQAYQYFLKHPEGIENPPNCVLPVVVHIIHNNGIENITDATVLQGIQDLNDAFANVNYYDQGTGVNTQIQFCLAKQDPNGNMTTGINRVQSGLTEMNLETQDLDLKNLIRWEPENYINIWLVREICSTGSGCGVAGYAYFPTAHGMAEDGIVMEARWFGSTFGNSGVQIHEMGHYLGLKHTFQGGCVNNDCLQDGDNVCDTPPDQSTVAVPCGNVVNSCSTDANSGFATDQDDMYWNYMDYGDWDCYSAFTQGQSDRMIWHIENVRSSLLDSKGCNDPCLDPIIASFFPDGIVVDAGSTVSFFNNSSANATTFQWLIDGTPFANSINAAYIFNQLGTFEITLIANHNDPNCEQEFSLEIQVVCPVDANFDTSNLFPLPGENVIFTNTSVNGVNYEWSVNNAPVTTDVDYAQVVTTGVYWICLKANNGFCEEEFCQSLFVFDNDEIECTGTFVKKIGEEGVNETANVMVATDDGNFLLAGKAGNSSLLMLVNNEGQPLWQRTFDLTAGDDFIFTMHLDSEGMLVGAGRDQGNGPTENFIFRYDYQTDQFLWIRRFPFPAYSRFDHVVERPNDGNYLAMGLTDEGTGCDAILMEIDRGTGTKVWQRNYDQSNCELFMKGGFHNNALYTCGIQRAFGGLDKIRPTVVRLDIFGNQSWSNLFLRDVNANARLYAQDLTFDNDKIIIWGRGNLSGSDLAVGSNQLYQTDLSGNIQWAKRYEFSNGTQHYASNVHLLPDGYLLQGNIDVGTSRMVTLLRTDKDGNLLWAKEVGGNGFQSSVSVTIAEGHIWLLGHTDEFDTPNNNDLFFAKLTLNGEITGSGCDWTMDAQVEVTDITNPYDGAHPMTEPTSNYDLLPLVGESTAVEIPVEEVPGCECDEFFGGCDKTFIKTFGTAGLEEEGRKILIDDNGNLIMGAMKGDSVLISLLESGSGTLIWERTFKFTDRPQERLRDLRLDSDGYLVGAGFTGLSNNDRRPFAFRYDYLNDNLIWGRVMNFNNQDRSGFWTLLEKAPDDNFYFLGQTADNSAPGSGCDGLIMEVNRVTGAMVWMKNYQLGSCETFQWAEILGSSIYTTGRHNFAGGGTNKMRPAISLMDLNGTQIWSKLYLVPVNPDNARLYSEHMIIENNAIHVLSRGDISGSSATDNTFQLFKTDLAGNIQWAKNYDIPGASTERMARLVSLPDGFFIYGQYILNGTQDILLMKISKNGDLLWSKSLGGTGTEVATDLIFHNGFIYLLGGTPGQNFDNEIFLAKLTLDGETEQNCPFMKEVTVIENLFANPYDGDHPLVEYTPTASWNVADEPAQVSFLEENILCETPCVDTCSTGAQLDMATDAVLFINGGQCANDSMEVEMTVCNYDNVPLPAGNPITFYNANPTITNASILGTVFLPENVLHDSCLTFTAALPLPPNTFFYAVVNDTGTTMTPFVLQDDFPNTSIEECDFTNNLDSFLVQFDTPLFDLGPDTVMCDNGVVTFNAGSGYTSYEWQDGSTDSTYTAWGPGTYWVKVTDVCGGMQTDSISVIIEPPTIVEIGNDTTICLGDTVIYTITGFDTYKWTPADFVDCDTCNVIVLSPDTTTCYILVAGTDDGCYSVDTVKITVNDPVFTFDTTTMCENDTLFIFGDTITEAGQYSMVFTGINGCDSTHTEDVFTIDTVLTTEMLIICQNEMADIFGTMTNMAGDYPMVFLGANGCDSTHLITLEVLDTFATAETVMICAGDSALIFNNFESQAGDYTEMYEAVNGCDSMHTITLDVLTELMISFQTTPSCQNSEDGTAIANVVGGLPPYSYNWSIAAGNSPTADGLAPGNYSVTVTDDFGCIAIAMVEVGEVDASAVDLETVDVTCFGDQDGAVFITSTLPNLQFSLDNEFFAPFTEFENLAAGNYTLYVLDENNCVTAVNFIINQPPELFVQVPEDVTIELGDSLLIPGTYTGTGTVGFSWFPPEGLSCADCPRPTAKPITTTEYELTIADSAGCSASDALLITVIPRRRVYIPNVFSPNGDGFNDYFHPFGGPDVAEIIHFKVFDRWGELVFKNENFPPNDARFGWDGTFRGEKMDPAVFVWFAEIAFIDGTVQIWKGDVVLVK